MPPRSFVYLPDDRQWHILARVDDTGWLTHCGRNARGAEARASDHLPDGERLHGECELLASQRDAERERG